MGGSRGGTGGPDPPPLKNHKNIGFLRKTGPDPLKITKLPSQHSMWGPSSARQRNAISMAFRWRADDGLIKEVFGFYNPPSIKKNFIEFEPHLKKLSGSVHGKQYPNESGRGEIA